jgi:integrase
MPRARGEGSVYREKATGRWVASISWLDDEGKRRRKKARARTKTAAADKVAELLAELEDEQGGSRKRRGHNSTETLAHFLDRWMRDVVTPGRAPKTVVTYETQVRKHIKPALGHVRLDELGPEDVQRFLNAMRKSGLSASTVDQARRVLSAALHAAVDWDALDEVPLRRVRTPRGPKRKPVALNVVQIRRLLAGAEALAQRSPDERRSAPWLHAVCAIAVTVAAREGEILGLRWQDVDLESGVVHIRGQLQRGTYEETKTHDTRVVVLPPIARLVLVQWAARQAQDAERAGRLWRETGYVFTTQTGGPLMARNVYRAYKALVASAGLPAALTFHDLRHTSATLMAESGVHRRLARMVTGHKRDATLADIYEHVTSPDLLREVAEVVNARLEG